MLQNKNIQKVAEEIKRHGLYKDPFFDVHKLAEFLCVDCENFEEELNKETGETFQNFINKFRVEEAKEIIHRHLQISVEAIVRMVGFNDKTEFFCSFRKYFGFCPDEYMVLKS